MMRGRFVQVGGTPVEAVSPATMSPGRSTRRDIRRKTAGRLRDCGRRGEWWPSGLFRRPLVYDGEGRGGGPLGRHGGAIVNVLGRDMAARIASLRKVNWRSLAINFVLVYSTPTPSKARPTPSWSTGRPSDDKPEARTGAVGGAAIAHRRQRQSARSRGRIRSAGRQACAGDRRVRGSSARRSWCSPGRSRPIGALNFADATILKILGATGRLTAIFLMEYAVGGLRRVRRRRGVVAGQFGSQPHGETRISSSTILAAAGGGLAIADPARHDGLGVLTKNQQSLREL